MELVEPVELSGTGGTCISQGPRHPVELVEPVELANLIVPGTPCVTGGTSVIGGTSETYHSHRASCSGRRILKSW